MKPRKLPFNMIEVIIALAIIVTVVVSVLSLLPRAMMSNQEAINRMAAADTGEQFLNFFSSHLEKNWIDLAAFPDTKNTDVTDENDYAFSTYSLLPNSRLEILYEAPNESSDWNPLVSNKGLFRVKFSSNSNQVDFDGYIRAWKETTEMASGDSSPQHVRLQCEISWPASLPYDKRRKRVMGIQVYKPGAVELEASAIASTPCMSAWAIEGTTTDPALYRYTLSEELTTFAVKEGDINGLAGCNAEALAVAANGAIFFINSHSSENSCALYRISRGSIDGKSGTEVHVAKVGETGISNSAGQRLTALQFVNDNLYAVGEGSQIVYKIDYTNGKTDEMGSLNSGESNFVVGGMSVAADGFVYLTRALSSRSEVWRFDVFPTGPVSKVDVIDGSGYIRNIAAHPGGWIFLYDGTTCYRFEPLTGLTQSYLNFSASISDMDFYYIHEYNDCGNIRACEGDGRLTGTISVNPTGNTDFGFEMITQSGAIVTRDDLQARGSAWEFKGKVYEVRFKPKAGGSQDLTLDGDPYRLDNSIAYVLKSDVPFSVHLYNDKSGTGVSMGHWLLELLDAPLTISFCGDDGGNDIIGTPTGPGISDVIYKVNSGAIEVGNESTVSVSVVSCSYYQGNTPLPITVLISADGVSYEPFAGNVNNGTASSFTVPVPVSAGGKVIVAGTSFDNQGNVLLTASSSPANTQVQVFVQDANTARLEFELESTSANQMEWVSLVVTVTVVPTGN